MWHQYKYMLVSIKTSLEYVKFKSAHNSDDLDGDIEIGV